MVLVASLPPVRPFRLARVAAAIWLLATILVASAGARIVVPSDSVPDDVQPMLERLRQAFEDGDHEALTALMHTDGVRLGLGPQPERTSLMTPAQAHYYFKNRFQLHRTIRFSFLKHQHASGPDRLHSVVVWQWERTDTGRGGSQRLLLVLTRDAGNWRVSEMTALRGG